MSAIAGCYWFDQRPARVEDLAVPTTAAAHRAGGPFRFRCDGPAGLAYAGRRPESNQPYHDPRVRLTVIVDGRLDNLDDVAAALGTPSQPACGVVATAYRRWGRDLGAHLLGDFVVLVYDEAERRLVCLRDSMGQRPLFYGVGNAGVVFGSEAHQVVRHPEIPSDVNEGVIAEHLTNTPVTVAETLWRAVKRLPPAHALEIADHTVQVNRFCDFDPEARVAYDRDEEYDEHFRELLARSVECRTADCDGVGVLLSGGLDSSSVAGMAQTIGARLSKRSVHALSIAFPGRACDETSFVDAVVEKWRLPLTRRDVVVPSRPALEQEAERYLDLPMFPNSLAAEPLRESAADLEIEVMLTGCGGDEFFAGNPAYPLDMIMRGQLFAGARAFVRPLLSDRARRFLKPIFGARQTPQPWINTQFARRTCLRDRCERSAIPPFPTDEQRDLYSIMSSVLQVIGAEVEDRAAQRHGLDIRHPLFDRRIAEFGLALPSSQRWQGRQMKVLLRRALRDYLPPVVANRQDKAEFSPTYVETLEALGGRPFFTDLRSCDAGWVDGRVAADMYDRMMALYRRGDDAYIAATSPLFAIAALEIWLERAKP